MKLLYFAGLLFLAGCTHSNKFTILFDDTGKLTSGADVVKNGVRIGKVERLSIVRNRVAVDVNLKEGINVPKGSSFVLVKEFLDTPPYVDVKFSDQPVYLLPTDTIEGTQRGIRVLDVLLDPAKATDMLEKANQITDYAKDIIDQLKDTLKKPK